jgi:hypothetical protein
MGILKSSNNKVSALGVKSCQECGEQIVEIPMVTTSVITLVLGNRNRLCIMN